MITKHVSLWYNIIYNMIKLQDNYLFYFAKICLKYTSSNMFWIVLLNKNLRTFWGWFVIKHPINKNSISLTSEIVCFYMRVFTVLQVVTRERNSLESSRSLAYHGLARCEKLALRLVRLTIIVHETS